MIRVLVVDDSAVLRQSTRFILESDPELKVVGVAGDGAEAVSLVGRLRPDVITMDIQMPKMDGLEAIRQIMADNPAPIVVVTGIDPNQQSGLTTQATQLGAVSIVHRPEGVASAGHKAFAVRLIQQVKLMSAVRVVHRTRSPKTATPDDDGAAHIGTTTQPPRKVEIVAIGSSTGGPAALHKILSGLSAGFPAPIVIVQHISFGFVEGLASWLNDACPLHVKVAQSGEKLQAGSVYLAPDDHHMLIDQTRRIGLSSSDPIGGHRPSVTSLFQSVAKAYSHAAVGVILTGMGADGAAGMKQMRQAGAVTIAQDQASCVVFGMPKEAIALDAVQHIVPLDKIASTMQAFVAVGEPS